METSVVVALIAGVVSAFGWLINHILTDRRDRIKQRTEALLKHVERQLEELYGPMAFLLYEGRRNYQDLLDTLKRDYVFIKGKPLSDQELKTWLFWAEKSFLPRNEQIKELLAYKTHLIEGTRFPDSYIAFLDHQSSWSVQHKRWKEEGVEYSWHSKINWSVDFEREVIETFEFLKAKHTALLGKLTQSK